MKVFFTGADSMRRMNGTNTFAEFARFERDFWDRTGPIYSEGFGPITSRTVPCLLRHLRLPPPRPAAAAATAAPGTSGAPGASVTLLDVACGPGIITAALKALA